MIKVTSKTKLISLAVATILLISCCGGMVFGEDKTNSSVQTPSEIKTSSKPEKIESSKTPEIKKPIKIPTPEKSTAKSIYYSNCTEVREANAAPIYKGEPGYRLKLDRNSDGVACE